MSKGFAQYDILTHYEYQKQRRSTYEGKTMHQAEHRNGDKIHAIDVSSRYLYGCVVEYV